MSFRDRFFTKPVAEAIMSPSGILLAGAGVAAGVLIGLNPVGAVAIGAAAWAGRVGTAIPRGPVRQKINRRTVSGEWQRFVDEALSAQRRFAEAVERTQPGPVRDRLQGLSTKIEDFVHHSYEVAQGGQAITEARSAIDTDRIVRDLHRLTGGRPVDTSSSTGRAAAAMQAQLATASRMDNTIAETHNKLVLLDARLDELVTRSIELSVTGSLPSTEGSASLGTVEQELVDVVDEMEAVRQAVAEVG